MAIDNKNLDKNATFVRVPVTLGPVTVGASQADVQQATLVAPYNGKVVAASFYAVGLTDADDSVTWDVKKNGTSILSAPVDPVAADTVSEGVISTAAFDAGDELALFCVTGSGDAITSGTLTLVIRPLIGSDETGRPTV